MRIPSARAVNVACRVKLEITLSHTLIFCPTLCNIQTIYRVIPTYFSISLGILYTNERENISSVLNHDIRVFDPNRDISFFMFIMCRIEVKDEICVVSKQIRTHMHAHVHTALLLLFVGFTPVNTASPALNPPSQLRVPWMGDLLVRTKYGISCLKLLQAKHPRETQGQWLNKERTLL